MAGEPGSGRVVDVIMGAAAPSPIRRNPAPDQQDASPSPSPAAIQPLAAQSADPRRFLAGLCIVLASAVPLCLFFGTRGFAPVVGAAGLLCIPLARPARQDWRGVVILVALVLWAAVSIAWSPAPNLRLPESAKALSRFTILHLVDDLILATAFVAALARLDGKTAGKALIWISFGFLVVPPLLIEEGLTQARLYQALPALIHRPVRPDWIPADLAQASYVVAAMAWPLGVALFRRGRLGWVLALSLAAWLPLTMLVLRGEAPTIALAISLPVFFLALRFGRKAVRIMQAITVAYFLAAPAIMLSVDRLGLYARFKAQMSTSWAERLRIWGFVAEQWTKAPLRGAGLDASRTFPGVVPLHPHNGPLQLWYELGLPGALLGTLFWLWLWGRIGDCAGRNRLYGATAAATATAYLTLGSVSFGLWQEWWLCVGAFAMALCVMLGRTLETSPRPG
jgi:O-antigen ligase